MLLVSAVRILISLFIGIFAIYFTYKSNYKKITTLYKIDDDIIPFAILFTGVIITTGIIVSATNNPLSETYKILRNTHSGNDFYTEAVKYTGLFLLVALFVSWLVNIISFGLFVNLTKSLNSLVEERNKKVATALIGTSIIFAMGLMIYNNIEYILMNMVPYPVILP